MPDPKPTDPNDVASVAEELSLEADETLSQCSADELVSILDEYLAALKNGTAPTREVLFAIYPHAARQLAACLAGLEFIHGVQSAALQEQSLTQHQLGDFRIIREVGRGGMGAVYEAKQVSLARRVAVKVLRFGSASDKESIERFQREAETVATLHHTNIVPIFFVGSEDGVNFYAMQFIDGRDLAAVITDPDFNISSDQVSDWALQAAEALMHAHQRGVVHRDVKPSNLILDQEGRLWLTDFGLARRLDDVTISMTGMLMGTPRYMSPEQAAASSKRVDHRSDLFSLGATLYELLTATPAFAGESPHDVIQHILNHEPVPIRRLNQAVPKDLETIVMKCLAKEPQARYRSALELAQDLRAQMEGRPIRARRAHPIELAQRWLKQHQSSVRQMLAAAAGTMLLIVLCSLAWQAYASWNRSSLLLDALDPLLVTELRDASGRLLEPETLPMQAPKILPAGDYQVRVSDPGQLSETYEVELEPGRSDHRFTVGLSDTWLLPPQPLEATWDVVDLGAEHGVVLWSPEGVALRRSQRPEANWSLALFSGDSSVVERFPGVLPPGDQPSTFPFAGRPASDLQPYVLPTYIDVNGDGVGDILCAARHQAWLMAVSGTGQEVLWFAGRGEELSQQRRTKKISVYFSCAVPSYIARWSWGIWIAITCKISLSRWLTSVNNPRSARANMTARGRWKRFRENQGKRFGVTNCQTRSFNSPTIKTFRMPSGGLRRPIADEGEVVETLFQWVNTWSENQPRIS